MLPTNVMSFMKKFTTQPDASATSVTPEDGGRPFSKLRQSVTDLMSATGNVTKLAPAKVTSVEDIQPKEETTTFEPPKKPVGSSSGREGGDRCRVCLKFFKPEDISKQCYGCQQKVCEDCASYSTTTDTEHDSVWRCSICRRKHAARGQPVVTQESTESLLGVPIPDSFQRRHSDARLNSQVGGQTNTTGSGLAPPRSPEQRRHSDVSPASLKELEKFRKVAGERREELRWERELEWRSKSRSGSPDRLQERGDRGRGTSPQRKGSIMPAPDLDPSGNIDDEDDRRLPRRGGTVRRKSKVTRQHSYDDEIKTAAMSSSGSLTSHPDPGLGPPVQLPRRASAYDVYAAPGGGGIAAMTNFAAQHRASISQQGGREPEDRQPSRRSSFRAVKPVMPYEMGSDDEKMINLDAAPVPEVPLTRRRASQLPDITSMRGLPPVPGTGKPPPAVVSRVSLEDRELPRQGSLADGEGIKIVIHDVDSEHLARPNPMRKVKLRRDSASEKVHRTGGFGMRVVGGKSGSDGHMYASIVWTVPGGPAEKAGLQRGDKVLEWSGVSLIDRRYEDVAQIIDHSSDIAEVIVEHTTDPSGDSLDDPGMVPPPGKAAGSLGLQLDSEADKTPTSPTRRKLPKTPEQIAKERQVSGRVQIQIWYETDREELVVSVLAADELCLREDTGYGSVPEAFAKLSLKTSCGNRSSMKTDVAEPTHNPIWNATLNFTGIAPDKLLESTLDVTLWDCCPDGDCVFLGETTIDLTAAFEADRAIWYRLEDPRGQRSGKSPYVSPRGSLSIEIAQRLLRRTDLRERSYSDDTQSDSGSPEPYFLHPDHAWLSNSRRGSSQSEQLEVEPYELNKDYSRSLPGSRRSSFQSQGGTDSKRGSMGDTDIPVINYTRRRSSFARPMRDPEEILEGLRSLQAAKGELGRTMSLNVDKRRGHRRGERRESSVLELESRREYDRNNESDEEERWSGHTRGENGFDVKLGPAQVPPKDFRLIGKPQNGELQLGVFLSKGNLEVEIISARGICPADKEEPDTYIKTYLRDEGRWLHKRKTRVVRHSRNPQFRQTLKYPRCDALGRNLLVMLWEKKQGFESNQGLGGAEINLDALPLTRLTISWYILFPIHTLGTQTADSP